MTRDTGLRAARQAGGGGRPARRSLPVLAVAWIGSVAVLALAADRLTAPATGPRVLAPPDLAHPLGTTDIGQSVLAVLAVATPVSVAIAIAAAGLTLALAVLAGLAAACGPRVVQLLVLRVVDILQILPSILVLLLLSAWLEPGPLTVVLLLGLTNWHDDVRVLRSLFLRELTRESLQQARLLGYGWRHLLRRHLLPPIAAELRALFLEGVRQAALKTAGLGFLGLLDPRLPTWGGMMQDALGHLTAPAWAWLMLPPTVALSLFLLAMQRISADPSARFGEETAG